MEHSLVVYHNHLPIFSNDEHWLYPLFELETFLKNHSFLVGELLLQDKIAGKAAACLIVRMGFTQCHIGLLSRRAIPVFEKYGVRYSYDQLVDHIQCRTEDLITDKMDLDETYLFLRKRAGRVQGTPLKIEDLTVTISGKQILQNLNLELGRGEQLIVMGENGSGKTTLLKSILGLLPAVSGKIWIGTEVVGTATWQKNRAESGYLNQEVAGVKFPITAAEVVAIGLTGKKISTAERKYQVELAMRKTRSFHLNTKLFHELSGGEKQRVSLARLLCQNARLLLLDEPTSFLDDQAKRELAELLIELSKNEAPTILVVSHDKEWIQFLNWKTLNLAAGTLC